MESNIVTYSFNLLPPSVNHAMLQRGFRRFPSKELTAWVKEVEKVMPITTLGKSPSGMYCMDYIFYFPLYYKNGNVRKRDADDMVKYATDTFCKRLKSSDGLAFDDKMVLGGYFMKKEGVPSCTISIYPAVVND